MPLPVTVENLLSQMLAQQRQSNQTKTSQTATAMHTKQAVAAKRNY